MGAQDDNQGTCCPSMGCTPPLPLPKFRQQSGLAASGTPWAAYPTTYLPHKMQKGTRHFLTFYGFRIPATFAQIPTCAPRLSGGADNFAGCPSRGKRQRRNAR